MTRFGQAHRTLHAEVPEAVLVELGRMARQGGRPLASLVRDALAEYVARHRGGVR